MSNLRHPMRLEKCVISAALLVATMASANLNGGTITFPVGTPVHLVGFTHSVAQDGFGFIMQNGSLSINLNNLDGAHPDGGGLRVSHGEEQVLTIFRLDGQPFGLQTASLLETSVGTGIRLSVLAKHHETGVFFDHEFSFDLNSATYDTLDFAAADSRFLSVDTLWFESLETPFFDPSRIPYIIDSLLTLSLTPADFDGNGFVDGSDLAQWETSFGVDTGADADGDSDSDGIDFLAWQQQFTGPGPLAATTVPEPSGMFLFGCLVFAGMALHRRL